MAETSQRKLAAIMFTDIVGYSALTQQDVVHTVGLLDEHMRLLRALFPQYAGQEIKMTGDGFMVEFASPLDAARCAIAIQKALGERNAAVRTDQKIQVRIGIHVGDVVHRENDVFGDGVNIAARIEPLARPGGICLSQQVVDHIRNQIDLPIVRLGRGELKNIQVPVTIHRVVLPWERARLPYSDRLSFRLKQKRTRLSAALVLVVLSLAGVTWSTFHKTSAARTPVGGVKQAKSIAVLPFQDTGSDEKILGLCDNITEDLSDALVQVEGLDVKGPPMTSRFRSNDVDIHQVGKQLNVGTVLRGSVQTEGNSLRIRAALIDVANGFELWGRTFNRTKKALLDVQEEICQAIVSALKHKPTGEQKARFVKRHTEDPEAYILYSQGRYFWNQRSKDGIEEGIRYFEKAKEKDPNYALAYAGLADSYTTLGYLLYLPPKKAFPKAKEAAMQALKLDDTLAEAYASLGYCSLYYDWNWAEAEQEFKRAIKLKPKYETAHHWYSVYLAAMGKSEADMAEIKEALRLDPTSQIINTDYGWHLYLAKQYEAAIEQLKKTLEMYPDFPLAHLWLGRVYAQERKYPEAISELKKVRVKLPGSPLPDVQLGQAYGESGNRAEAQRLLDHLLQLRASSSGTYVPAIGIAFVYSGLDEKDQAIHWLQEAYRERSSLLVWLKYDPRWDKLRGDPRVTALLKQMNLET